MDLFFNELSIKESNDKEAGKRLMTGLIDVFRKARSMGLNDLKTTEAFVTFPLAPGYSINDWLFDKSIDLELRRLIRIRATNLPYYIEQLVDQKDDEQNLLHEFKYKEQKAMGLGAAYMFDSFAVSFANSSEWDCHLLDLNVVQCTDNDLINVTVEQVKHASKTEHLDFFTECLIEIKRRQIANGKLLWLKRNEYFPHLIFLKDVEKQVDSLTGNELEFHIIKKRLFELEDYCSTWISGAFTLENFPSKVTPESESRRSNFKDELKKMCPDGIEREFSLHLRYTPGAGRIHFFPDNSRKKVLIGYIGLKIQ